MLTFRASEELSYESSTRKKVGTEVIYHLEVKLLPILFKEAWYDNYN